MGHINTKDLLVTKSFLTSHNTVSLFYIKPQICCAPLYTIQKQNILIFKNLKIKEVTKVLECIKDTQEREVLFIKLETMYPRSAPKQTRIPTPRNVYMNL